MGNMLRDDTKKILRENGIRLSKKLGQSHLVDENILERIIEYAEISPGDTVLEIGSGIGNLTIMLAEEAERVIAIEKDARLVKVLSKRLENVENVKIIQGDALEKDLPKFDKIVSNIPYSISSPLTFRILEEEFDMGILTYQKEFAERMVAQPGSSDYGRLSVNISYKGKAEILEEIPPEAFIPRPEVKSCIVRIETREAPFKVKDDEKFSKIVKASFQQRRKKIRNSMINSFDEIFPNTDLSKGEKRDIIDNSLSDRLINSRPENLSPEDFGEITDVLIESI